MNFRDHIHYEYDYDCKNSLTMYFFSAPYNVQAFPHPSYAPRDEKEQNTADFSLFYTYSIHTIILETTAQMYNM